MQKGNNAFTRHLFFTAEPESFPCRVHSNCRNEDELSAAISVTMNKEFQGYTPSTSSHPTLSNTDAISFSCVRSTECLSSCQKATLIMSGHKNSLVGFKIRQTTSYTWYTDPCFLGVAAVNSDHYPFLGIWQSTWYTLSGGAVALFTLELV